MMKVSCPIFIAFMSFLLFTGCNNEENPVTVKADIEFLVHGTAVLRPYIYFYATAKSIYPVKSGIDSAKIGDSLCSIGQAIWSVYGTDIGYVIRYGNEADSLRYRSGDTVDIVIYGENETVSTRLKLLSKDDDTVHMIAPLDGATIAKGEDLELIWNKIDNADWYSIYYSLDTSLYSNAYVYDAHYTEDTIFTIPGTFNNNDGELTIRVNAVAGPVPDEAGNIRGSTMTGCISSEAEISSSDYLHIIVGIGIFPPSCTLISDDGHEVLQSREGGQ